MDVLNYLVSIFIIFNLIQIVLGFQMMFINGRFVSFTGNPQHAAMAIVGLIPIPLINLKESSTSLLNVKNIVYLIFLLILLLLTGSRTGLATCLVLFLFYYYNNSKKILSHSIIAIIIFLITFQFIGNFNFEVANVFDRLEENGLDINRTSGFTKSFNIFLDHPLFGGVVQDRFVYVENSYLACLSNFGLVGLLLLIIPISKVFQKAISNFDSANSLINITSAILIAYFVGALFEAYLLANISFSYFCFIIYYMLLSKASISNLKNNNDAN
ncbi:O-antigen ligase family protein [Aquimarina agarivorans]|uniref:O-antigen ligase family protein n=1 Tax=Aquimarina agarivorans TaxID=980584 RepID=UPI0002FA7242|nr:O-antigen ligase family protein [Aquimarina agarivorans]